MSERDVVELKTAEQLLDAVGQLVQVEGVAQRSKAGSFVVFDGVEIWCTQTDWNQKNGMCVRVVGTLSRGSSPLRSFPIATQDENGFWSQGVLGGPDHFMKRTFINDDLEKLGLSESKSLEPVSNETPIKSSASNVARDWLLRLESVVVISKKL